MSMIIVIGINDAEQLWALVHSMPLLQRNGVDWHSLRSSDSLPSFKKRLKTHYFFLALKDLEISVHLHLVADYPCHKFTFRCDLAQATNLFNNNNYNGEVILNQMVGVIAGLASLWISSWV